MNETGFLPFKDMRLQKYDPPWDALRNAKSEEAFNSAGVNLFKELGQYVSILACTYRNDTSNKPVHWSRNDAILRGLLIRCTKLMMAFLDFFCKDKLEIVNIITRCIAETVINMMYLIQKNRPDLFDEFVITSLNTDKRFLEQIEENVRERGYELPIEVRMKKSITNLFRASEVELSAVNSRSHKRWGGNIFQRFKDLGLEESYVAIFGLQSHFVHGNWGELLMYHLDSEDGKYSPHVDWNPVRPQPILALSALICEGALRFLEKFLPSSKDKDLLKSKLQDHRERSTAIDDLHERFLQSIQ